MSTFDILTVSIRLDLNLVSYTFLGYAGLRTEFALVRLLPNPNLTCRANHRHNIIIARILKPVDRELAAGFFNRM